jgi:hypothetical protein
MEGMTTTSAPPSVPRVRVGRGLLLLGVLLTVLGPVLYIAEIKVLHRLVVPWYAAVLGSLGALLALAAFVQARTILGGVAVALLVLFAGMEWMFLGMMKLPHYEGPVAIGKPFPAFTSTRADGPSFTQDDLQNGKNTVLVFFRGRW